MSRTLNLLSKINQSRGINLGLDNVLKVAKELGNVQNATKCIHVAGTNGKGSVSWKLSQALSSSQVGARVGLFTSPHISTYRERVRVDGQLIPQEDCAEIVQLIFEASHACNTELTYFETLTLLAMMHFKREDCDVAVLECGLGGLTDSTNIIPPPLAAVVTSIALDHQARLGSSLEEIAIQKAGIIKPLTGAVVISDSCQPQTVFEETCAIAGTPLHVTPTFEDYNIQNAKLASRVLELIAENSKENEPVWMRNLQKWIQDNPPDYQEMLTNTKPPCRFEVHSPSSLKSTVQNSLGLESVHDVILDVAHNPAAFESLAFQLITRYGDSTTMVDLVVGFSSGKDVSGSIQTLERVLKDSRVGLSSIRIVSGRNDERAQEPAQLVEQLRNVVKHVQLDAYENMHDALNIRNKLSGRRVLVVCGSFFVMDEALEELGMRAAERDELDMNEKVV